MSANTYDTVIIGAGPAGLMAVIQAAAGEGRIAVLEKTWKPALKLRITGKGRCNLTNDAPLDEFIAHFGKNGRFLKYAFHEFPNDALISFFEERGVPCKLERGGRWFPESDSANDIAECLLSECGKLGVTVSLESEVSGLRKKDDLFEISLAGGDHLTSDRVLLATGGKSYPKTGSTGTGHEIAFRLGHTVIPLSPSLVPLYTEGDTAGSMEGLSLKNIRAEIRSGGKKQAEQFGEMVFTDRGVSGPVILTLSRYVIELKKTKQETELVLDLKPALDHKKLDARLLRDIENNRKRQFKYLLKGLLPTSMIKVFLHRLNIPEDTQLNQISADKRKSLRNLLKEFILPVTGYAPLEEGIVTAGGIPVKEINPQTMESRKVPGLFFAGEIIDINADTGGYNLQAAFSTGFVAGCAMRGALD